jgi:hypothetical protein
MLLLFAASAIKQPYRLRPDNHAQVAKDNQGDISGDKPFDVNNISPCISPEKCCKSCSKRPVKAIRGYRRYLFITYNGHCRNQESSMLSTTVEYFALLAHAIHGTCLM